MPLVLISGISGNILKEYGDNMSFTSLAFLLCLLGLTLIYYLVPKKAQWVILLIASYAFYIFSGAKAVVYLVGVTAIGYVAGLIMQKMRDGYKKEIAALGEDADKQLKREIKKKGTEKIKKVQALFVVICLAILIFVKYINDGISNLNEIFSLFRYDKNIPYLNLLVPLGISFFTFASLGYIVDIGRGKYDAEKNFFKYALFISFFPSIVQGPINRFDDVGKQLQQEHKFDYDNFVFGAELILWGFFKKLVIADRVAPIVTTVFSADYLNYSGTEYLFAIVAYGAQIYGDFSGGIDIARGAAQILGIEMPDNFSRPYFSTSLADFWRRWHITLGGFMRDYVFYSIMLSKPITKVSKFAKKHISQHMGKTLPSIITSFCVFTLIGVWHGANSKQVAFGLYNATVVSLGIALTPVFKWIIEKLKINTENFSYKVFQIVRTFLVISIARIFPKAPSFRAALHIIKAIFTDIDPDCLFGGSRTIFSLGVDGKNMFVLFIACLVLFTVSVLQENGLQIRKTLSKQSWVFRWGLLLLLLVAVLVFGVYGPSYSASDFIYQAY